jgi:hypothetical protein
MSSLEHTADENPAIDRNFQKLSGLFEVLQQIPFFVGTGTPNGVVTSSPPAIYFNRSGGAGTTIYLKESGAATSAGWVGK